MATAKTAFLFDVDNTLIDNDRVQADLMRHLERDVGAESNRQYWKIFEELRSELGYADYLGALQRYRVRNPRDFRILAVSDFLINYPFANRLYPASLDVIEACREFGDLAIVSDGDVVFQPLKVHRSGLYEAFNGNVLIYIHKEQELDDIAARYPADHYVFIDDKVRILTAIKKTWGAKVTTVFPRQGHYALDRDEVAKYPAPDVTIERINDLLALDLQALARGWK
ncbi:HAD family hydrolase [bacterium]|nr:HAD family hydrolase [bacterium]